MQIRHQIISGAPYESRFGMGIIVQNYFLPFFRINRKYKKINKVRFWMPTPNQWGIESIEIAKVGRKKEWLT